MTSRTHSPIRPLPDLLVSQIAAGEVVERPASVVKELVENALDAMASSIWVSLEEGGRQLIRVRDDGLGIPRDELPLALGRHCTSKLQSLEQLLDVHTLGFRGEALPSIASVARLRLTSCARGATDAFQVSLEGADGRPHPEPAAHPPGTTVEVRELFFNVPARRRFMKSTRTELEHIDHYLRRLALSRPRVSFHFSHAGRRVFSVAGIGGGEGPEARLGTLMGPGFARAALPVEAASLDLGLSGWVAQPELFAPTHSALQIWVVNGRVVRDPALAHAVRVALDQRLPNGRYPAYCLVLSVDPASVDVNVHPTKLEVRHRDPRRVHDFVLSSLCEAMGTSAHPLAIRPPMTLQQGVDHPPLAQSAPARQRLAEPATSFRSPPAPRACASPGGRAWLVEEADGLWVLDLAMHYADLLESAYAQGIPESLPLLIPAEQAVGLVPPGRAQALLSLTALGLMLRVDADRLRLVAAPACLRGLDPCHLLRELLALPDLPNAADRGAWAQRLADWLLQHWPPPRLPELLHLDPPTGQPDQQRLYRGESVWTWLPLGRPGWSRRCSE